MANFLFDYSDKAKAFLERLEQEDPGYQLARQEFEWFVNRDYEYGYLYVKAPVVIRLFHVKCGNQRKDLGFFYMKHGSKMAVNHIDYWENLKLKKGME
jgi:hypothetical protein